MTTLTFEPTDHKDSRWGFVETLSSVYEGYATLDEVNKTVLGDPDTSREYKEGARAAVKVLTTWGYK